MKTTLFISAALLFSFASFAQTSVTNSDVTKNITTVQTDKNDGQLKASTTASSSTGVQSNAVTKTESKANSDAQKTKKALITEKKAAVTTAKAEEQDVRKANSEQLSASAGTKSSANVTATGEGNKMDEKASINSQVAISPAKAKAAGNQLKEESKTAVVHAANAKPASIKMNAKVKTNTAIRIK